jgi:hypothetical protein
MVTPIKNNITIKDALYITVIIVSALGTYFTSMARHQERMGIMDSRLTKIEECLNKYSLEVIATDVKWIKENVKEIKELVKDRR